MTEELSLKDKVFRAYLQEPNLGPEEMATKLGFKYNSVKDAYARLTNEGLLTRNSRGNYPTNYNGIIFQLLNRVEVLEKKEKIK